MQQQYFILFLIINSYSVAYLPSMHNVTELCDAMQIKRVVTWDLIDNSSHSVPSLLSLIPFRFIMYGDNSQWQPTVYQGTRWF